jgi:hypothetical protein
MLLEQVLNVTLNTEKKGKDLVYVHSIDGYCKRARVFIPIE